jgi:hypothetical protein|tara:strand:+ start:1953 stop:2489 length:537 start_codon:yes stop_codon:yes gene_type:complete
MKSTKPTTLELGTIIHGTMRVQDTMPALLSALDGIRLTGPEKEWCEEIQDCLDTWIEVDAEGTDSAATTDAEGILSDLEAYMNDTLIPLADSHAPDYCYVGSHPGDGSDLGVWPCEDLFDDTTQGSYDGYCWRLRENNHPTEETIPADMTHALAASDHGNATLFARGADGWTECWSIV